MGLSFKLFQSICDQSNLRLKQSVGVVEKEILPLLVYSILLFSWILPEECDDPLRDLLIRCGCFYSGLKLSFSRPQQEKTGSANLATVIGLELVSDAFYTKQMRAMCTRGYNRRFSHCFFLLGFPSRCRRTATCRYFTLDLLSSRFPVILLSPLYGSGVFGPLRLGWWHISFLT